LWAQQDESLRGLPFTRTYSLEDIGYGSRGARLGFDRFGRVAVIHDGLYAVLNDTAWLNLAERGGTEEASMTNVVAGRDGRWYYGSFASWGTVAVRPDGLLHATPLVPPDAPEWTRQASFTDLIATEEGVYFISPNGVVFRDGRTRQCRMIQCEKLTRAFRVGPRVYVSAYEHPLQYVDVTTGALRSAAGTGLDHSVVVLATALDENHALIWNARRELLVYDGKRAVPWLAQQASGLTGPIAAIEHLVDGHVAIGVTGRGLYLFSASGELLLALTSPEYHRITALANREPGVLWVGTENAIEKVLYSGALTAFGQRLGLTVDWPIVQRWKGETFVASGGNLYRAVPGGAGTPSRFELAAHQPPGGAWALAAAGEHMLIGSASAAFAVEDDGTYRPIADIADLAHLVMIDADHCYAISRADSRLLEFRDGEWREVGPRARGVTYPTVVHRVRDSVWIEMGGQVGRLWVRQGHLQMDLYPNAEWTKKPWVNIGSVDDIVVLSSGEGERRFFDERAGAWCEAPQLSRLLDRSPFWLERVEKDRSGTIWGAHVGGVVRFAPHEGGYEMDATSFDLINDRYPVVQIAAGTDVWISTSQSLYHVERRWADASREHTPPPVLVSMVDAHEQVDLLAAPLPAGQPLRLSFTHNSPTFRFYAGTDAWRRPPAYEYRLTDKDAWTPMTGSELGFRGLYEGSYTMQIRLAERLTRPGTVATVAFEVLPPWHRTWPAYIVFSVLGVGLLGGIIRWSSYLERRHSRMLEEVVRDRTRQLEATMAKLGEETRNAATLAERDRVANEIHDSVQQGLTGAILQLDTTLKLAAITGEIRERLDVVRNMVSYARQEVQHAIWDMESPLLQGADLAAALRMLPTFADAGEIPVDVVVEGTPLSLERPTNHNLLRIAQEAMTNAFRHADARRITIRLVYTADTVLLEIADDGRGFSPDTVLHERVGHLGLRGIRARVKRLGGRLTIDSAPGRGASIRVRIHLAARKI
jgi:signal transduction histidine kinase